LETLANRVKLSPCHDACRRLISTWSGSGAAGSSGARILGRKSATATTKQARRAMGAGYLGSAHERRASHKPFSSSERQP